MKIMTQSGEAHIMMEEVVAVVRHLPHRDNFNVDIHMRSGTIFTVCDSDVDQFEEILTAWEWATDDANQ
tara:strand:+ start:23 stop:229 length:207 start_codon:yes stop_codon:yes gene_type:complete